MCRILLPALSLYLLRHQSNGLIALSWRIH